jgi:hypothetical protein
MSQEALGIPSGLEGTEEEYDLVIIGAGLSGGVIAERASKELGLKSLLLDKRDHIGGNCFDFIDEHGFRISRYGVHLFHTVHQRVWDYVNRFSEWMPYEHRVKGRVDGKIVPIPPSQTTVNMLFNANVSSEEEMEAWLEQRRVKNDNPQNGEEAALSRAGPELYEKIFKYYTKKQWDKFPAELDASVLMRIPVRLNTDDRYFTDPFQALPKHGYTRIFENMLLNDPNITIRLRCPFASRRRQFQKPSHRKRTQACCADARASAARGWQACWAMWTPGRPAGCCLSTRRCPLDTKSSHRGAGGTPPEAVRRYGAVRTVTAWASGVGLSAVRTILPSRSHYPSISCWCSPARSTRTTPA